MKILRFKFLLLFIFPLFWSEVVQSRTVGSDSSSSRQLKTFFPVADTDNLMLGFTLFEEGFMLEDSTTTCSFDALFPVSGSSVLNGGRLDLIRDLELEMPFSLGPGIIDGHESFVMKFPSVSGISVPTLGHTKLLSLFYDEDLGEEVNSVDWSYDDNYLAIAIQGGGSHYALEVYYVDDLDLTLTASVDLSGNGFSVRWHPSEYYLAVGGSSGDELEIYYLNVASGTFAKTDGFSTSNVNAVAWTPNGIHLAVGRSGNEEILVYDVASGVLGTSYSATYSSYPGINRTVQRNALDWDLTNSYLAVGLNSSDDDSELKVFCFTGTAVFEHLELEVGSKVSAVGWHPTEPLLAIGKNSGSERLLLYEHDAQGSTLNLVSSAQNAGATRNVYGVDWTDDGNFIAAGMDTSSLTFDLGIFVFDSVEQTLNYSAGSRSSSDVEDVSWSHDGTRIATGDSNWGFKVFQLVLQPLVFRNIDLFFKSDVTFRGPVIFEGNCLVNGGGNIFNFDSNGSVSVASGGSLILADAVIIGVGANDVACVDDTAVLTLSDVEWIQDSNYTFSVGALRLKNDIIMAGDAKFIYSSSQTSTLLSESNLQLDVDFTFSYDPPVASRELIVLYDETSSIILNGATLHATSTGMRLTTGRFIVDRASVLSSEGSVDSEGISFASDLSVQWLPAANLDFLGGVVVYE